MNRITCAWVPHFAAETERRRQPDGSRPLLVREGNRVFGASSQAVRFGVSEGSPLQQALAHCPDALVVQADHTYYHRLWEEVIEALRNHSPVVDGDELGVAYLDATGVKALHGGELQWSQAVLGEIRATSGMAARIGIAGSVFAAWVAAKSIEDGSGCRVVERSDRSYLAPFPVTELPLSAEARRRLWLLGIHTLGQFARLPVASVAEQFGPEALEARRWARGEDRRPLSGQRLEVLDVSHEFDVPMNHKERMLETAVRMSREPLERWRRSALGVRSVTLEATVDSGKKLERTAWVGEVVGPDRVRSVLHDLLSGLGDHGEDGRGITELRLRVTGLKVSAARQLALIPAAGTATRLEEMLSKLAKKHSVKCVYRAHPLSPGLPLLRDHYELREVQP